MLWRSSAESRRRVSRGRWMAMYLGLFGSYRKNETVDIEYSLGGEPKLAADVDIQRADLGAKGIYYRARVGPFPTRSEAIEVCEKLKAAGSTCIVTR